MEIRLFSIFTLRQIADDYPDYQRPVVELLTAYVRALPAPVSDTAEPPADVIEIMKFIREQLEQA